MSAPRGQVALVLHTHMPYVEGFGTYPFGEEWLFDAVIRSYLPVLEVARDLTMTVTNLFDTDPPIVGSTIGSTSFNSGNTYPSTYDALGRRFAIGGRLKF